MGPVEWGLLLGLSLLWGGSYFFNRVALDELPPLTVALGRVALGAVVLNLIVLLRGLRMPRSISAWRMFAVMGALNNLIPFSLILWGQTHIASGLASILNATTPLFTVVLAHLLTRDERMTAHRAGGVLFGLLGVTVLIGPDALRGLGVNVAAQLAMLGAAVSYSCAGIYGRRFRGTPPLVTATGQVTATAVMVLPLTAVIDQPWTLATPAPETATAVAALALLSTALGYLIYFRLLGSAGATNVMLVTFLIPVSALLLGTMILDERLDARHFAGMALIGLGLATIDGRAPALLRTRLTSRRVKPRQA
jgi:drug/metabolite transporter (DMT)-like permease